MGASSDAALFVAQDGKCGLLLENWPEPGVAEGAIPLELHNRNFPHYGSRPIVPPRLGRATLKRVGDGIECQIFGTRRRSSPTSPSPISRARSASRAGFCSGR